jgi:hypothetical protein
MNAASYLWVCQHNTDDDARYMAKKIGVELVAIPRVPLKFMIWFPSSLKTLEGYIKFVNDNPKFSSINCSMKNYSCLLSKI